MLLPLLALVATVAALPPPASSNEGRGPTVLQYVLEAVVDLRNWKHYLPDDLDADNDGILSEIEVEQKFKSYMRESFDILDQDSDKLLTQHEFRSARIDLQGINRIIDIIYQSWPLKPFIGHGDRNQDGFITEDDFLRPENADAINKEHANEHCGGECDYEKESEGNLTIHLTVPEYKGKVVYMDGVMVGQPLCLESLDLKGAEVLCRELGYNGLDSLTPISLNNYYRYSRANLQHHYPFKFECEGSEGSLDECTKSELDSKKANKCFKTRIDVDKTQEPPHIASVTCKMGSIHLAGGKDPSSGDLHIGNEAYCGPIGKNMATVVCRQLGFLQGVPQTTRNNFFGDAYGPTMNFKEFLNCDGSEDKLEDCVVTATTWRSTRNMCRYDANGIICKTDEDLIEKYGDPRMFLPWWEGIGRYFFIADTNGDGKVSIDELKAKVKDLVGAAFKLLDQTNDGFLSVKDGTTLNLRLQPFLDLVMKLFEIICEKTGEELEFDLLKDKIRALDMSLEELDQNLDGIANLKDFYKYLDEARPAQVVSLVGIVAKHLDINQDGKIHYREVKNYMRLIFKNLDADNNDAISLGDVYKLMQKGQFTCLQIEGIRTFVDRWNEWVNTGVEKLLAYFFTEFDLDGNGEIPLEEFYNAHVPCDHGHTGYSDYGERLSDYRDGVRLEEPNRHRCHQLAEDFFAEGRPSIPSLEYGEQDGYGGYGGGYGGPSRYSGGPGGREKSLAEKLSNSACIAMQPSL